MGIARRVSFMAPRWSEGSLPRGACQLSLAVPRWPTWATSLALVVDLAGEVVGVRVEDFPEGGVVRFRRGGVVEVPHVVAAAVPGGVSCC